MSMVVIMGCIELGLIYSLLALGIFISFRILNIPDLTTDGSFPLGTAVSAIFAVNGHPFLGIPIAFLAGALAGTVTGLLNTKMKIPPILAGILTMTGLYSVNLRIMGNTSNLAINSKNNIFTYAENLVGRNASRVFIPLLFAALVICALTLFFKTQLGLSLRATGDNEDMVRSSSINSDFTKVFGIALSNGIIALSGALLAQYQGFSDVNLGTGMIVMGLACLIIGEVVFGKRTMLWRLIAIALGAITYRIVWALVLKVGLSPNDMKLISAVLIAIAISFPAIRQKVTFQFTRKRRN